jgi:hypothetical protein
MNELHIEEAPAWVEPFRALIQRCDAEFLGVKDGSVLFRADSNSPVCALYPCAIRSVLDIQLALKSVREKQKAAMWEFENAVKPTGLGQA